MTHELAAQFGCPTGPVGASVARVMHNVHAPDYAAVLAGAPSCNSLLEIGMGLGLHVPALVACGVDYTGVDRSPDMVEAAQRIAPSARFICADVCDARLPDVDVAIAVNSLQWWAKPLAALRAIRAAVGTVVIGISVPPPTGLLPDVGQRHYAVDELRVMLRDAGFGVVEAVVQSVGERPYIIARGMT